MDYIRNSKNRKLKTQILSFFSRIHFGTYRLGLPGKVLIFANSVLALSLFFPWIQFQGQNNEIMNYGPFSLYLAGIGYGIIWEIIITSFFLLSHEKKEFLRAYVPFRLSDAQAIVFLASMIFISIIHVIISSFAYTRISSQEVTPGFWLEIALGSCILIIIISYFFSQNEKSKAVSLSYLEKKESSYIDEYNDILNVNKWHTAPWDSDKNMTLPI